MSTQWSPESLFSYVYTEADGKRFIRCQMHDPFTSEQCPSNVPDRNVPEFHISAIALAAQPIDCISDAAIDDIARLSVCENHLNTPSPVASRWKAQLVNEIKARWRDCRHKLGELQKINFALAGELIVRKERLEVAEGNAKALQVDLTIAEGKQIAMESEVKVLEHSLESSSWGVISKLFSGGREDHESSRM